ncbi:MAG TPA: hypothetical protein VIT45_12900 [Allosphingosinicella sp.]
MAVSRRGKPVKEDKAALKRPFWCIMCTIQQEEAEMDFVRNMQQKDWVIAAIAFIAGAIIF